MQPDFLKKVTSVAWISGRLRSIAARADPAGDAAIAVVGALLSEECGPATRSTIAVWPCRRAKSTARSPFGLTAVRSAPRAISALIVAGGTRSDADARISSVRPSPSLIVASAPRSSSVDSARESPAGGVMTRPVMLSVPLSRARARRSKHSRQWARRAKAAATKPASVTLAP